MSQEEPPKNADSVKSSSEPPKPASSLAENLETLLADLLGIVVRYVRTVALFLLTPARAALTVCVRPPDYRHVLRPFTFLFVGCLLYSFLLGGVSYATSSHFAEFVGKIAREAVGREFSFTALLVRSLPLVIVTSLFATIAGMLTRTVGDAVRTLLVYLYGLQGSLLLLFVLAMAPLGNAFQKWLGSDDYLILVFLLLILILGVQGYRVFRRVINGSQERPKVRVMRSLAFAVLFYVPMPLAGYVVVGSGLIADEVHQEPREQRVSPVRIIDADDIRIERDSIHLVLTALVHNQSKFPFLVKGRGIDVDLYLLPVEQFDKVSVFSQPDKRVFAYLDLFDRYRLLSRSVRSEITSLSGDPALLAPAAAAVIAVAIKVEGSSVVFEGRKRWDAERRPMRPSIQRLETPWNELAEGHSLVVRLIVRDSSVGQVFASEYFRVAEPGPGKGLSRGAGSEPHGDR